MTPGVVFPKNGPGSVVVTEIPTPGVIFFRAQPRGGKKTRTASFGSVEWEVEIIGRLGPRLDVFDVQNGGHGEVYFCLDDPQPGRPVLTIPLACKIFPSSCCIIRCAAVPFSVNAY